MKTWAKAISAVPAIFLATVLLAFSYGMNSAPVYSNIRPAKKSMRIMFAGDLCFGNSYKPRFEHYKMDYVVETEGYDYPFEKVKDLIATADFGFINLETPLTTVAKSPYAGIKDQLHHNDPVEATKAVKKYGGNAVSVANNHALDFGREGLEETIEALNREGISWFGAGMERNEARKPFVKAFEVGKADMDVVVLGGYWRTKTYDEKYKFYAGKTRAGVNKLNTDQSQKQVAKLRQKYPNALLIVYPHFGKNYKWKNEKQVGLAHTMIDAGADIIIGHGAHCLQEFELYKGKWIFYNLGNYVFITPGKYRKVPILPYSFIAMMDAESDKKDEVSLTMKLYPVFCDNRQNDFQLRQVDEDELSKIYSEIMWRSPDVKLLQNLVSKKEDKDGQFLEINIGKWTESGGLEDGAK